MTCEQIEAIKSTKDTTGYLTEQYFKDVQSICDMALRVIKSDKLIEHAYNLSTYVAASHFNERHPDTQEFLTGLEIEVEKFQDSYHKYKSSVEECKNCGGSGYSNNPEEVNEGILLALGDIMFELEEIVEVTSQLSSQASCLGCRDDFMGYSLNPREHTCVGYSKNTNTHFKGE